MGKKKDKKRWKKAGYEAGPMNGAGGGLAQGLSRLRNSEQFLLGALIGAGAIYVLGDEALRGKLLKAGMRLYGSIAGNFEEMKEQLADIRAEMAAEQGGA